jgi:hypothetical protein
MANQKILNMQIIFCISLLFSTHIAFSKTLEKTQSMNKTDGKKPATYAIAISARACTAQILLNHMDICSLNAEKNGAMQSPCNTELVGKGNELEILVTPAALDTATLQSIFLEGSVISAVADNGESSESEKTVATFDIEKQLKDFKMAIAQKKTAEKIPLVVKVKFDSPDAPSFEERLKKSVPITDQERLISWAMEFRDALKREDIDKLYFWYEPKLIDYDIAYPDQKEPDNKVWFNNWLHTTIFPKKPIVDFDKKDIELRRLCDGRIWEIRRKGNEPLLLTGYKNRKRTKVQIYVGMVGNDIRIVR